MIRLTPRIFVLLTIAICFVTVTAHTGTSRAAQHFWDINEVYSNADGSVQFVEMFTTFNNQQFLTNHRLKSTGAADFVFSPNSSSPTANHHLLIATGPIGGVNPDYTLSPNFLTSGISNTLSFTNPSGTSTWDSIDLDTLPTDGVMSLDAIFNNGNTPGSSAINAQATPMNYAGDTVTIPEPSTWTLAFLGAFLAVLFRPARKRVAE